MTTMKALERQSTTHERPAPTPWLASHLLVLLAILSLVCFVTADCECGYSATIDGTSHVFTDLIETDFTRVRDVSKDTVWAHQAFNMSSERARGDFGEIFVVDNVGSGSGTEKGLESVVKAHPTNDMIPVAEIDTARADVQWGTFRASLKLPYYNDTAEIDMEFLSKDFHASNNSYPVNLVLQSRESAQAGYNAASTGNFIKTYLPFDPASDFHEYRFDFIPNRVSFYADGQLLGQMNGSAVPTTAGHLVLSHWSNGNPLWSGGPPTTDAMLSVKYVKAYFNSSTAQRHRDWAGRCRDMTAPKSVCAIPEITPTNSTPGQFFFSDQNNMTNNQTLSGKSGGQRLEYAWTPMCIGMILAYGFVLGLW